MNLFDTKTSSKWLMLLFSMCILCCFLVSGFSYARTVKIVSEDENSRLELRNITLPDGTDAQIYVIKGESVKVTIDENSPDSTEITASHIEYDQEASLLRIIGEGVFKTQEEEIEGKDFSISLKDDTFDAFQVEIVTGKVTVRGADATRFPGQLDVSTGSFSFCGRCDQEIEDYGFAAEEMRLYPKDRLIAYDVTVLVRENPIFYLPLLILPLGPEDKQPRFDLTSGNATSRAKTSLHWPYIFAESSFGRLGVNYYADVLTKDADFFSEQLLGGAIATSYFGLDWFHRFYTDRGQADVNFNYVPSFVQYVGSNPANEPSDNTRDQFNLSLKYSETLGANGSTVDGQNQVTTSSDSEDLFFGISRPQINFMVMRNDGSRQRIGEYELSLKNTIYDYKADFFSQGYYDFDSEDDVERPSYSTSFGQGGNPNVTYGKLRLEPINPNYNTNFEFGSLNLSGFIAELGFFQDDSNSGNRSASQEEVIHALRLLLNQPSLTLNITVPVIGTNVNLTNDFKGQYYSTQNPDGEFERLILWNTRVNLTQNLDKYVSLTGGLNRIYRQGETPFSFDGNSLQERTDANFGVNITPFDWFGLNFSQNYVLYDSRDANSVGWGNLSSSLRLFDSNNWFNMNLNNSYDFKNEDPGFLRADIHFRFPAPNWYLPSSTQEDNNTNINDLSTVRCESVSANEVITVEDKISCRAEDVVIEAEVSSVLQQSVTVSEDSNKDKETNENNKNTDIVFDDGIQNSGNSDLSDQSVVVPALEVSKVSNVDVGNDGVVSINDVIDYRITIRNQSDAVLNGITVIDNNSSLIGCSPSLPHNNFSRGDVIVCNSEYVINQADLDAGITAELSENMRVSNRVTGDLTSRANYNIALDIDHQQDLKVEENQRDESRTSFRLFGNYDSYLNFNASTAYNYVPDTTSEPYPYWDKLNTSITAGTQDTFDGIPNITLSHIHDLNTGKGESLTISAGASYDPFEFTVSQTFNLLCQTKSVEANERCDISTSSFKVLWRNVMQLDASGFALIPISLFLLDPELDSQEYSLTLTKIQAFQDESANWSVRYKSIYDPFLTALSGETGGWKDSSLSGNYELLDSIYGTPFGDVRLASNISAEYLFADDLLLESYFRRITLNFRGDLFGYLGVAGDFGYDAVARVAPDADSGENVQTYTRNELNLRNVSFTTQVVPDVYVAAVFNDLWDFRDIETVTQTPWNFQPEIHLIWDRCCWALSGSWDSSNGEVSISLGLNDIQQGFSQEFETEFVLPGRNTQ